MTAGSRIGSATGNSDPNFATGHRGLVAVDKVGNRVLFLEPDTLSVELVLDGFAPRVHEVIISPDHLRAYIPIYGDGIHGRIPHPGSSVAVIDLAARRHVGNIETKPFLAPHGLRWGATGQLYCVCENSGVVLEFDLRHDIIRHVIPIGSDKAHRIEVLPDGSKLYSENEEDPFASVVDLQKRTLMKTIPLPNGSAGLGMSPDGNTVVFVDARQPQLLVVNTATDEIIRVVRLHGFVTPHRSLASAPTAGTSW